MNIEELIDKLKKKEHHPIARGDGRGVYYSEDIDEFIADIKSLQEPTEERECENCKKLQKELDGISFSM